MSAPERDGRGSLAPSLVAAIVLHGIALALAYHFAHEPGRAAHPSTSTTRMDDTGWVLVAPAPVAPPVDSPRAPVRSEARVPRAPRRPRTIRALAPRSSVSRERSVEVEPSPSVVAHGDVDDDWTPLSEGEPAAPSMERPYASGPLATFVDLESRTPPAPKTTPRRRRITPAEVREAVRAVTRSNGRGLGLESPHEGVIAHAVQEAGRETPVPSGTHFVVTLALDRSGRVVDGAIRGDGVGDRFWADTLDRIRTLLAAQRIPIGPDERDSEARVVIRATVLHVKPSGSTGKPVVGDCPQLPQIGGEEQPSFFSFGGTPYLQHPSGTCLLRDASDIGAKKIIVVRTDVTTHHAFEAPPPASTFPMPRPKKLLPSVPALLAMILDAH